MSRYYYSRISDPGNLYKMLISLALVLLLPLSSVSGRGESDIAVSSSVSFVWSGRITTNSARIKAKLTTDSTAARLAVSELSDFSSGVMFSTFDTAIFLSNNGVVTFDITGLLANRQYYYALEIGGIIDMTSVGQFRSFPTGEASFTLATGGDSWTGSNHVVFETIRQQNPIFFLHTGDIHYNNIGVNDRNLYRQAYDTVLASVNQSRLYREVPIAYIWDDHDYGLNNSDSNSLGRVAARLTYQEYVPHYSLAEGSGDVAIYQAFTVGRVRFILTDLRSARSPWPSTDNTSKTMMGTTQKAWFKQELLSASANYALIVWVSSMPWIGITGDDGWFLYTNERREIANFIKDNSIKNLCMIGGDAHMIAIDDGSNSDYATGGGAAFPVFHATSLDRLPSVKGGPYSHGNIGGVGFYGLMSVTDSGDSIRVDWSGRDYLNQELMAYSFAFAVDVVTDVDNDENNLPFQFSLSQNYPNPFNPTTTIEYEIPRRSDVLLVVYNILGRRVQTLIDEIMPAGTHYVSWDSRDTRGHEAASGIYLYRLEVSGMVRTRRMILLR